MTIVEIVIGWSVVAVIAAITIARIVRARDRAAPRDGSRRWTLARRRAAMTQLSGSAGRTAPRRVEPRA